MGLQPYMGAIPSNTRTITQIFSQLTAFIGLDQFKRTLFAKSRRLPLCLSRCITMYGRRLSDTHSNDTSTVSENYYGSRQQKPAAARWWSEQAGSAGSATGPESGAAAGTAASPEAWSGHKQDLNSREPRLSAGFSFLGLS